MSWLWLILIGFVIGLVARALKPGDDKLGIIMTTVLGVLGSLGAGWLGRQMGWYGANEPAGFVASVIGAILLLVIYGLIARNRATAPRA